MPSCKERTNSHSHWCVSACVSPCPHLHLIAVTPSDKLETSEQPKYSSGDKMYAAGDNTVWKRCGAEVAPKAHRSQSQATSSRGARRRASWDERRRRARIFMRRTGGRRTPSLTFMAERAEWAEEVRGRGLRGMREGTCDPVWQRRRNETLPTHRAHRHGRVGALNRTSRFHVIRNALCFSVAHHIRECSLRHTAVKQISPLWCHKGHRYIFSVTNIRTLITEYAYFAL